MATSSRHTSLVHSGRWPGVIALFIAAAVIPTAPAHAQQADASRSAGLHVLLGGFAGRFDLHAAGETELLGARAGIGFGELVQLTGFYWRGFERDGDGITPDYAAGGELQLNLNAGFGISPFVVGGIAHVAQDGDDAQTAAVAGAGLVLPVGPVLVHVGARDYMFGVTGLRDASSPEGVTHNWLYSAGVTFALGARRPSRAVAAAPAPPETQVAVRAASAELAALRDSIARLRAVASAAPFDTFATTRNYHSAERIEIPIPTEGSITLRYGPEAAAAAPIVVTAPVAAAAAPTAGTTGDPRVVPPPAAAGAPAAAPVVVTPASPAGLTQAQLDAITQRVMDVVIASVMPRLDAVQAQRMNVLREELRGALAGRRTDAAREIASAPFVATPPAATPGVPAAAPIGQPQAVPPADPAPVVNDEAYDDVRNAALALARAEAAQRLSIAAVVADHPRYLTAHETERGPAAVLGDAAFESGAALVRADARAAIAAIADVLRAHSDRRIYIHGHTDAVGAELQNQRLSELRAEAVRSLLVQHGIESDRVFAVGYGQARPVADNSTARGRALNRRAEIVIGESRSVIAAW